MISEEEIKKNWNLEGEITKKLKKYENRKDNRVGIICILRTSNNYEKALLKYGIHLDDPSTSKTTNDLIVKAKEISKNT